MDNVIGDKSFKFAIRIVKLCKYLSAEKNEFILSKQLIKSGTSVGANVKEGIYAQSKNDFISKMNIALKEIVETEYWLELMIATDIISKTEGESLLNDCIELKRILHSIVKTSKSKNNGDSFATQNFELI